MKPRILTSIRHISVRLRQWLRIGVPTFSRKDQLRFIERLSFLVRAGMPIIECIEVLSRQETKSGVRNFYGRLVKEISQGKRLSSSLTFVAPHTDTFLIACIRVGERSGSLSENLLYVAEELKNKDGVRKKILGALVYPSFIICAAAGIVALIVIYIFPKILPIFQSLNIELPLTTRALISVVSFISEHGILIGAGAVLLPSIFILMIRRSSSFRISTTKLLLRVPFIGDFVRNQCMTLFTRMHGLLLKSGVSILETTSIVGKTFSSPLYQRECVRLEETLSKGGSMSKYLKKSPLLFPPFLSDMIGIGENSGSLAEMFLLLSNHFTGEIERQIRIFTSMIEPVLMVGIGLLVGFIAVSIITPLYQITEHLHA